MQLTESTENKKAYLAVKKQSGAYVDNSVLNDLYNYCARLRNYYETTYSKKWLDLALYTAEDVIDCALEILGDTVFSRFFTNAQGVLTIDYTRMQIALQYVTEYVRAYNAAERGNYTKIQDVLLQDTGSRLMDVATVYEDMKALSAYVHYTELYNDTGFATIIEKVVHTKPNSKYDTVNIDYRSEFAYYLVGGAIDSELYCLHIDNYKLLIAVLSQYFTDIPKQRPQYGEIYNGIDYACTDKYLSTILSNSSLYYTGYMRSILRKLSINDTQMLLQEIAQLRQNIIGEVICAVKQNDKRAYFNIVGDTLYIKFKKKTIDKALLQQYEIEKVVKPTIESR